MEHPAEDYGSADAPKLGDLLIASGKMTSLQADAAAILGQERNLLFGQAAIMLGFVSPDDVQKAINNHREKIDLSQGAEVSDDIVILKDPQSPRAADIRRLAQALALRWFRGEHARPALSVISLDRHEGRTTVICNLACIFARAGIRTLLIDADLHNPGVHTRFGLEPAVTAAPGYYSVRGLDNLAIIPASALFDIEYEKFMQSAFTAMIEARSVEFDVIFVDTPAASVSNDYLLAGAATKGAILVTKEGVTRARPTARMLNSCEDAGIPIVGGVMLKK